jgi:hypothetical protein
MLTYTLLSRVAFKSLRTFTSEATRKSALVVAPSIGVIEVKQNFGSTYN